MLTREQVVLAIAPSLLPYLVTSIRHCEEPEASEAAEAIWRWADVILAAERQLAQEDA